MSPKNCNPPLWKNFDFFTNVTLRQYYFTGIRKKCYYFNTLFTKPNGSPSKGNPYNKQPGCYLLNSCFCSQLQEWTNCAYLIMDQRKLSLFKRSPQLLLDPSRSCKFGHIVWSAKDFQSYFPAGLIRLPPGPYQNPILSKFVQDTIINVIINIIVTITVIEIFATFNCPKRVWSRKRRGMWLGRLRSSRRLRLIGRRVRFVRRSGFVWRHRKRTWKKRAEIGGSFDVWSVWTFKWHCEIRA